jgi:hypothetical protein
MPRQTLQAADQKSANEKSLKPAGKRPTGKKTAASKPTANKPARNKLTPPSKASRSQRAKQLSQANAAVRQLPVQTPLPSGLRLLMFFQKSSLALTFVLVTAALFVYSTTMYTQQLWSKEYSKLKHMQRSERQMLTANEILKNQIIRQAEQPGAGLVPKGSENTIYLTPAPDRPAPPPQVPPTFNKAEGSVSKSAPLGY